jgi:hypothetical protein
MTGINQTAYHSRCNPILKDVGTTYDLCQAQDVPIVMKLGKHTNDHMVSFICGRPPIQCGRLGRPRRDDATRACKRIPPAAFGASGSL